VKTSNPIYFILALIIALLVALNYASDAAAAPTLPPTPVPQAGTPTPVVQLNTPTPVPSLNTPTPTNNTPVTCGGLVVAHDYEFADVRVTNPCFPYKTGLPFGWTFDPARPERGAQVLLNAGGTWEVGFNPLFPTPDDATAEVLVRFDIETARTLGFDRLPDTGGVVEIAFDATANRIYFR
jgi:hypothetical protein